MSGVHATQTPTEDVPGLEAYLDTLYEIVATGVEPPEGVSLSRIEGFLHEHARSEKPVEAFVSFFEETGLSVRPAGEARAPLRVLDPLPTVEPPPAAFAEPALEEVAVDEPVEAATNPAIALPTAAGRVPPSVIAVVGLLLLGMGAAAAWGYLTLTQLRHDLVQAKAQAADNRLAIEQLEHQTTEIGKQVGETSTVMRRFEYKHDVLLEALLPAPVERP